MIQEIQLQFLAQQRDPASLLCNCIAAESIPCTKQKYAIITLKTAQNYISDTNSKTEVKMKDSASKRSNIS